MEPFFVFQVNLLCSFSLLIVFALQSNFRFGLLLAYFMTRFSALVSGVWMNIGTIVCSL